MPKILVLMMEDQYPFTQSCDEIITETSLLVQQSIRAPYYMRGNLLTKAHFLKNLRSKNLVKVQSLLEDGQHIHLMYEYIDSPLKQKLETVTPEEMFHIHEQLQGLGSFLSNVGVKTQLKLNKIGFDSKKNIIKFFMGLDFEWLYQPEESELEESYRVQIDEMLSSEIKSFSSWASHIKESFKHQNRGAENEKKRKISFVTLPSRFNRMAKIGQRLNFIQSTVRNKSPQINLRSYSNSETVPRQTANTVSQKQEQVKKSSKRAEDRKYSGDNNIEMKSRHKLYQKQSDIKSQYGHNNKKKSAVKQQQANPSQILTYKTKSRIEEMKEKEYKEISNSKKEYLKDFLSVLEEDESPNPPFPSSAFQNSSKITKLASQTSIGFNSIHDAQQLRQKAERAISHSLKVIQKFKSLIIS